MGNTRLAAISLLALGGAACVPTVSRTNAKLDPGVNVGLAGGLQMIGEGETETGETTSSGRVEHVEVDVEFAHALDDGAGLAIQLKTPASIVFTTLDFYYALPSAGETYYGFGAEIGALPGVYGVVTQYFGDALFVTFTPRVLFAESRAENALLINPQLAFGIDGGVDLMGFASFAYHTGRGFDFDIDIFGEDDRHDYHKKYWLVGLASRF